MARKPDFIPAGIVDFFNWQDNFVAGIVADEVTWGILHADVLALVAQQAIYVPFYNAIKVKGTRTPAQVGQHKAARKTFVSQLRKFNKKWISGNDKVTVEDRIDLQVTVPDTVPSTRKAITSSPFVKMTPQAGARMLFECRVDKDSSRTSRHPDADVVEVRYSLGADPGGWERATTVATRTKARFVIPFTSEDVGKKVYAFFRWKVNSDDSKSGPFSAVSSRMISD